MKHKLLAAAGIAALLAAPHAAAQDSGFYVRGQAGYGAHTDIDVTGDIIGDVESEGNGIGSLGAGYEFGNGCRLETDVASLWTDLGQIESTPGSYAKLRTTTGMLNAIYDFNDFGAFQPYVGAGVGIVRGDAQVVAHNFLAAPQVGPEVQSPILPNSIAASCDDGDTGLGWQLLAGLGYAISDNLTWDSSYRYMNSNDLDLACSVAPAIAGVTQAGATTLEDVGAHALMTGFRYRFGASTPPVMYTCWNGDSVEDLATCPEQPPAPPPPPATQTCWDGSSILATDVCPPAPPPPPVQTYTCWDGSSVTDLSFCPPEITRGGATITELCGEANRQEIIYYEFDRGQSAETEATIQRLLGIGEFCDVGNIRVVGHTDTSGSAAYNLALSRRRAADARSELVRQGIPAGIITSEGKGETEPFVQTGDGVKEQLNRRTEVLVQLNTTGVMGSSMSSGSMMSTGSSMSTGTTTTTSTFSSDEVFTDSEGRRMRMDANGNFVYIN